MNQVLEPLEVGRGRFGVGGEAGDRRELEAVFLEVAERVVGHDDRVPLTVGQSAGVRLVEAFEILAQVRCVGLVVGLVVGVDLCEFLGHRVAEVRHPDRVLPEVRVEAGLVRVVVASVREGLEVYDVGRVEHLAGGALVDGVVHGRLEAAFVDHQVGLRDLGGLLDAEPEVVRFSAGLREVHDLGMVAGNPVGDVLQGVEGRGHLDARRIGTGESRAAGQRSAEDERADPQRCARCGR